MPSSAGLIVHGVRYLFAWTNPSSDGDCVRISPGSFTERIQITNNVIKKFVRKPQILGTLLDSVRVLILGAPYVVIIINSISHKFFRSSAGKICIVYPCIVKPSIRYNLCELPKGKGFVLWLYSIIFLPCVLTNELNGRKLFPRLRICPDNSRKGRGFNYTVLTNSHYWNKL